MPMSTSRTMIRLLLALLLALSVAGASAAALSGCGPREVIPQRPMPAGATFSGLWYSNYDDMRLTQNGEEVIGTFEYKDGGKIWGRTEGGVLLFDWLQEGDLSVGRREVTGKGYLVISEDGSQLAGRWGYGDSRTDGGEWTADKADVDYTKEK